MWRCPKCRSKVDDSFDVCWSCGTTPDGIEDPDFVTADEAEPIVSSIMRRRRDIMIGSIAGSERCGKSTQDAVHRTDTIRRQIGGRANEAHPRFFWDSRYKRLG
jgi:hypothetical protein